MVFVPVVGLPGGVGDVPLDEETDEVGEVVGVVLQQTQVGRPGGGFTLPPPGMKIGGKMGACLFRLSGAKHDTDELHVPGIRLCASRISVHSALNPGKASLHSWVVGQENCPVPREKAFKNCI